MNNELKHYGVIGMKWGTRLSKEVRGVKKAYKKKTEEQLKQYQEKWANHAPELQTKILKLYWDMDSAWDRNENVKADRISNKIFELENELGRGHNKIDREYDELVKKSKKQYGKDLVEARLKAYNRLYRRPFGLNELKHYGILGMKWGKRTSKQTNSPSSSKSSKHYDSLVSKYSQKGYSSEEAFRRAKNRIKTEKALAIAGGTALAAAGAYVAYKKYVKDTVLPSSTIFKQYGSFKPGQPIGNHRSDSFVYDKSDVKGRYGNVRKIQEYLRKDTRGKVFELNSKFDKATTVASPKKARDAFVDNFKNDRYFREDLSEALKRTHAGTDKQDKSVMALRKALSGKKKFLRGDAYDGFTKILKDDNKYADSVKSSYFESLKKQGVNAIVDRDTKKLARTRANRPIIRYGTWGTIPSPEHVTKEHVNYLKNTFKQQRTVKGRIGQVLNEGSKLIRKRKW